MDPLSLTTGILTLLGACAAVSKTLAKIRRLTDAPALIQAINNEMSDLQFMLMNLKDHLERTQTRNLTRAGTDEAVFRLCTSILSRAKDKMLEINSLFQYRLFKVNNEAGTRVNRLAFLKHHDRLLKFQAELQELRQRVIDIGSVLRVRDMSRIEITLNDLRANDLAALFQGQSRIESQLERLVYPQSIVSSSSSELAQEKLQTSSNASSSGIEISVSRRRSAIPSIKCTCSRQGASTYLQTLLGTLFLGYTTTLVLRTDKQKCLYHQGTEVRLAYFFPFWFLKYVIWLQIQLSMNGPLQCTLSCIQIIPRDHIILDMIQYGDVEGIKNLLVSGQISIKAQMQNGASLLHWAIWYANPSSTQFLVTAGADRFYESPHHLSVQIAAWDRILSNDKSYKWREILKSLFPEPDFDECYRFGPLHKAVLKLTNHSTENILKEDLSQLNSTDSYGRTALTWAAFRGDYQIIQKLLLYKPDCDKGDKTGGTPLAYACRESTTCMKLLLEANASIHWRHGTTERTLLHATVRDLGDTKRVEMLVEAGIDVNAQNIHGETALHLAIHPQEDYTKSASYLIKHGADPTIHDKRGNNALSIAVRRNCHDLVKLLLQNHQDHLEHLEEYDSFMHLTAEFADMQTLNLLAQGHLKRRNINLRNRAGLTPIQLALQRNNIENEWQDIFFAFLRAIDKDMQSESTILKRSSWSHPKIVEFGKEDSVTKDISVSDDSEGEFEDAHQYQA